MAREVSFPFFMFIWGYKLLAYTNLAVGIYESPQLAYTKALKRQKHLSSGMLYSFRTYKILGFHFRFLFNPDFIFLNIHHILHNHFFKNSSHFL